MPPEIPVLPRRRICKVVDRFTIELGSCPVKAEFPLISSVSSLLQFDSELAKVLQSPKCTRNISSKPVSREFKHLKGTGMVPVNWLSAKIRISKPGNLLPISAGMRPWSMFP
nr:unnamed protein product [Digitaria exilis]